MENQSQEYDFIQVAPAGEIPRGGRIFLEIDDFPIVIFNIAGELFAIGDVCTHDEGPLGDGELSNHMIACPRHGAKFDIRTGKVLTLPAVSDTPSFPVREIDGMIEIGFPKKK
jgi:3-phenylpropionate/trans-cinnamate dioxygenase ferredoxin subunit